MKLDLSFGRRRNCLCAWNHALFFARDSCTKTDMAHHSKWGSRILVGSGVAGSRLNNSKFNPWEEVWLQPPADPFWVGHSLLRLHDFEKQFLGVRGRTIPYCNCRPLLLSVHSRQSAGSVSFSLSMALGDGHVLKTSGWSENMLSLTKNWSRRALYWGLNVKQSLSHTQIIDAITAFPLHWYWRPDACGCKQWQAKPCVFRNKAKHRFPRRNKAMPANESSWNLLHVLKVHVSGWETKKTEEREEKAGELSTETTTTILFLA